MREFAFIIAMMSYRGIDPDTATCIELLHQGLPEDFMVIYRSGVGIEIGRSIEASRFMDNYGGKISAPYLLFIDDDQTFMPKDVARLLQHLRDGKRIVGGIYPVRNGRQLSSSDFSGNHGMTIDGKLQEAMGLATGFMGIDKTLLVEMKDKLKLPLLHKGTWQECYPFFVFNHLCNHLGEHMIYSEDWEFCRQVREIGEKIYADTAIQIGHIGRKLWQVEDVIAFSKRAKE